MSSSLALAALLAWGALAFGAVYPWAYWPLIVGAATVGAAGWGGARVQSAVGPSRDLSVALVVAALASSVQVAPLSSGWLARLSPSGDAFFGAKAALGTRSALSLDPLSTVVSIAWLLALTVLFVGSARWFGRVGVSGVVRNVMVLSVLLALVGIVQAPLYSGAVYGFWEPQFGTAPFGPFINENHFAGWMMMALPVVVGSFSAGISSAMRGIRPDWRSRVLWLSSPEANRLMLVAFATVLMGLALVLTFSRAGVTCFAVALLLSGWFICRRQAAGTRRSLTLAYVALVAVVGIGWAGVDAVAREFGKAPLDDMGGRLGGWQDAFRIISDFAWTGTGLNTYNTATLLYSENTLGRFTNAHNDYLQLAAEGGILVGVPLLVAAGFFMWDVRRRFRSGADDETTYWIRAGAVTGLSAIALQEVVDFSLQVPGNMVLFTVLCAIAVHEPQSAEKRT